MNPPSNSLYSYNFGQDTPSFEITPGKDCRLWPYVKAPGCSEKIYQCKSQLVHGIPPQAYQGMQVNYEYNLAGCGSRENYSPNNSLLFPACSKCTGSVNLGGCRCNANGSCGVMP